MASPKIIAWTTFDSVGAPYPTASASFLTYMDDTGTPLSPPTISNIGSGTFAFTPSFASTDHGIHYVISTGGYPTHQSGYVRPEDWNTDDIPRVLGLLGENSYADNHFYNSEGQLLSARIRLYDTAEHATLHNDSLGLIATYALSGSYVDGELSTLLRTKP